MADRSIHSDVYCYCLHAATCALCGKPRTDRSATMDAVAHIQEDPRPPRSNVFGQGPLLLSDIPSSATSGNSPIIVGIDEAGRGCVLGPMVYGMAYWSVDANASEDANGKKRIPTSFNDSKQLTEEQRDKLWDQIVQSKDIGFGFKALLPNEISRNMFRHYNLNEQSHDTAMTLIRKLLQANVTIQTCYIDTVGNAAFYQRKLQQEFPNIEFVVESKADAKYAPCSAASVVAKVMRDRMLQGWKFSEPVITDGEDDDNNNKYHDFGSGYPSDPKCKQWMDDTLQDPVFGYTDFVRFSWAPVKTRLAPNQDGGDNNNNNKSSSSSRVKTVVFAADLDEEEKEQLQSKKKMSMFLQSASTTNTPSSLPTQPKRKRSTSSTYFKTRKLQTVPSIM